MVDKAYIQKALLSAWAQEESPGWKPDNPALGQSSLVSQLIYEIFGGEILRTSMHNSWHFYNRIDGEIIDFTKSEMDKVCGDKKYEDLLSSRDETHRYFSQEDYMIFSRRFVKAFEDAVQAQKYPCASC